MDEIKREELYDQTEIMLFDILQELKKISSKIENSSQLKVEKEKPEKAASKVEKEKPKVMKTCKHCGQSHNKAIDYANCARKAKG